MSHYIDAIVKKDTDPTVRTVRQLAMHALAKAFDPIAEAEALHDLIFNQSQRAETIARALGRTTGWISTRLALLNLNEGERDAVSSGRMPIAQASAVVAQRRAERDGRPYKPPVAPPPAAPRRHCATCTCNPKAHP